MPKTQVKLTPKQEAFALEYVMNGKDATKAYREVYDTKTDNDATVWRNAHNVKSHNKVSTRIHQLEMQEFDSAIITIEERKKLLTTWIKEGNEKAVEILNKMEGVYIEKIKLDAEVKATNTVINVVEDKIDSN